MSGANRRASTKRAVKLASALLVCSLIVVVVTMAGIYFLLAGKNTENSVLVSQMESTLGDLVGSNFDVEMRDIDVGFSIKGKASFTASNIAVRRKSDSALLAEIGVMRIESNLSNALSANAGFDFVRIENARVNADILGSSNAFLLPPHFDEPLSAFGRTLQRLQNNIKIHGFRKFQIKDLAIEGTVFGRRETDPIRVQSVLLEPVADNKFQLAAEIGTKNSNINLISTYLNETGGKSVYEFKTSGISLREWLHDPNSREGVIGSNGKVEVAGRIRFRDDGSAFDPVMNIKSGQGKLRIGPKAITDVANIDLNFHFIIARDQIELNPSKIEIGRLSATLIGGIKPADEDAGYAGPLLYDIIMQKGEFASTIEGEPVLPAGFKIAGLYDRKLKKLDMNRIVLSTKNGAVQGAGSFGFTGETPSLKAEGVTEGISVTALKQFWPFFIADGARDWVHSHVIEGKVVSGNLMADIPPGIIFRLKEGAKLKPEHFKTVMNMEGFSFLSFGDMPPIRNGKGSLVLEGMQITGNINEGDVVEGIDKPIKVQSGKFYMNDFEAPDKEVSVSLVMSGDARSIAEVSDKRPLRVMERMKVTASQFSGNATADIAAVFPIRKDIQYDDVRWNVLLDLRNGSSSKPLSDRMFTNADLLIDANPFAANVTGTTNIDGVEAKVRLIEPIGKSGKVSRSRTITASMSNEDRKKLGFDLNPVIDGPIDIKINQTDSGESYEIDFQKARLSLPWVGWSKGKKIAAKASFDLKQSDGKYNLNDFRLDGSGFNASGDLVLDKSGLIFANMKSMSLNEGDNIALKAERSGKTYKITASGSSYDARGVMNTLIYESSFSQAQGERSVDLDASFNQVIGFENRKLQNARLIYKSELGKLAYVDLTAQDASGANYSVQARRDKKHTTFNIRSNNSGNALAFTNIYTRMEGGTITADLFQNDNGPYLGPVQIRNFDVIDEPRLASFASSVREQTLDERGQRSIIIPDNVEKRAKFTLAEAGIVKGEGYLKVKDAIIRNPSLGLTANGLVYNAKDNIDLNGTFMPANVVNSAISKIPILGALLSGRDDPFIGITYRLKGKRENPQLFVNPLSIVAPGVFKKVFRFRN